MSNTNNLITLVSMDPILTYSFAGPYFLNNSIFSQKTNTIDDSIFLQKTNTIDDSIFLQKTNTIESEEGNEIDIKNYEIQNLSNLISEATGHNIISISEFEDDIENKISLVFNMDLPNDINVDELEEINEKAYEVFSQKKYCYIDSLMVL
ncbi:hypothetical protein FSK24_06465 [Campylobacter jejuni]|nr:hypothetical protein [Campylobacter jejuni]ECL2115564.1 hypothetical protein [Campylobacter jejuni]HEG8362906.1 hypothetical protein [Campylobacter jejuni]